MKLKLSILAGALALAVSAQANAGILGQAQTAASGGNDLILSVWDATTQVSYTADLGVSLSSFLANPTQTINMGPDANMTSFLSGVAATDTTLWNVVAQQTGKTSLPGYTFLTTANVGTTPANVANSTLKTFNVGPDQYFIAANTLAGSATSIVNAASANATAYAGGTLFGSNFGGKAPFVNTAAIGQSQNFFNLTGSSSATGAQVNFSQFATLATLSNNGTLTIAAVPEPGEWALMLSGFGLIGFVAARRKKNTSMTFA